MHISILILIRIIFRPSRVKEQLKEKGVKNDLLLSEDPNEARVKRIKEMKEYADKCRKERAWSIINKAIENENPDILRKLENYKKIEESNSDGN